MPCPFCQMRDHLAFLRDSFAVDGVMRLDLPVFPTSSGGVAAKEKVTQSLEVVASSLGLPLRDVHGVRRFGGHTMRVSGARHLAVLGFDLLTIQLMARWASVVVLRYVSESPLVAVTDRYKFLHDGLTVRQALKDVETAIANLRERVTDKACTKQHLEEEAALQLLSSTEVRRVEYICNTATGRVHVAAVHDRCVPPCDWQARCGWKFGLAEFEVVHDLPAASIDICKRCLPREHQLRADGAGGLSCGSSSSTSISSSSD